MQMVVFIGIPGCGKSTFFMQHFFHTHIRVNLDMLRTRNRENRLMQFCFDTQMRFVVDNTNVRREDRQSYIGQSKQNRFSVSGYYFQSVLNECLERNTGRSGRQQVSERGLIAKYNQLQAPDLAEGFDELFYVQIVENQFRVTPWTNEIQ